MIKQFVKGRVYVFIDAANILYSQQTLRWKVDYEKLKKSPRRSRERFDIINISKTLLMSSKNKAKIANKQ